jgi:hypothetical protein
MDLGTLAHRPTAAAKTVSCLVSGGQAVTPAVGSIDGLYFYEGAKRRWHGLIFCLPAEAWS